VGRAVAPALERGEGPAALDPQAIDDAAREVLGEPLSVPAALIDDALDVHAAIASRTVTGGAAEQPLAAMLRADGDQARALAASAAQRRDALAGAEGRLRQRARERIAVLAGGQHPPGSLSSADHHSASAPN
jgi:hypothetical protein